MLDSRPIADSKLVEEFTKSHQITARIIQCHFNVCAAICHIAWSLSDAALEPGGDFVLQLLETTLVLLDLMIERVDAQTHSSEFFLVIMNLPIPSTSPNALDTVKGSSIAIAMITESATWTRSALSPPVGKM